ncbi:MAG: hypothetical protein ABL904_24940 [Hyphomicrobiaceae bacterium]
MGNYEQSHDREGNRRHEDKREDNRDEKANSSLADISAFDGFLQTVLWIGEAIVRLIATVVAALTSS